MIGQKLAHYEVTALIGKGGMGEVYRARDTKLQRDVALKLLPPDFATDADRMQRFEREARLLASMNHRNIATIHGFEQDGEHQFLVMELIEGEDLSTRLRRERIPTEEALSIARLIATGMEAAHAKGIIHRDLKPGNIKLTPGGGVRILDFGLARTTETRTVDETVALSPTGEGAVLGTAPYMSPEQLTGQPVDERTDIWAFGCVLYEMLAGISPYSADSSPETLARILADDPDFDRLPNDLPASATRVLRRCLEKDTHNRWHSIADVRIELDVEEEAPAIVSAGNPRGRIALLAAATFALGVIITGTITMRDADTGTGEPARLMIPVRDESAVVPLPESSSVAISPDGKQVVYVASTVAGARSVGEFGFENTQLFSRQIDSFESAPLDGTLGGSSPFFSPDGEWIGLLKFHDGSIYKIPKSGGTPVLICRAEDLTFRGVQWAHDGNVYFSNAEGVFAVSADGGEPWSVIQPDIDAGVKTWRFPCLLPDTRSMLLMRSTPQILSYDDAEIHVLDLDTGETTLLVRGG